MSRNALIICILIIFATHYYYPKWTKTQSEATISWDVSGYYMYLPAFFIYKDIKKCKFIPDVLVKYRPTPDFQQGFVHEKSGNVVMKYSIGQAVLFSPFFAVAHIWASNSANYPPDGFTFPYQLWISIGMLIYTIIGLIYLRKALLKYFDETSTALSLLGITLGTNYLNYAAIDGAMTHNTLFTIYAILIYVIIKFYESPTISKSISIGALVGIAALTRPTEIIAFILPILWGVNILNRESIIERLNLIKMHWTKLIFAGVACLLIGSIQAFYWKYVSGEWIVYSYQNDGFSWKHPYLKECFFSYKAGWLRYSPFMVFSLIGFIPLYFKNSKIFYACFMFSILFIYIAFSWDVWWYGGSLGQRAMVQAYPILAFPIAALIEKTLKSSIWLKIFVGLLSLLFIYTNIYFTHQSHYGGLFHAGQMNRAFFNKTLFTYKVNPENLKLLDGVREIFDGMQTNVQRVYSDSLYNQSLTKENQFSEVTTIPANILPLNYEWIRVSGNFAIQAKEWNYWTSTQFIVDFNNGAESVQNLMIRLQRHMNDNDNKRLYMDIRRPKKPFDTIQVKFWNGESEKPIIISDLQIETFDEK